VFVDIVDALPAHKEQTKNTRPQSQAELRTSHLKEEGGYQKGERSHACSLLGFRPLRS
jgi:hypothetical protein